VIRINKSTGEAFQVFICYETTTGVGCRGRESTGL
jgi:hypothetical protein